MTDHDGIVLEFDTIIVAALRLDIAAALRVGVMIQGHAVLSALKLALRLRAKQPKVVYLELCEDMAPLLSELRNCVLPVAVQNDVSGAFDPSLAEAGRFPS